MAFNNHGLEKKSQKGRQSKKVQMQRNAADGLFAKPSETERALHLN
jgi:hypothetical protein